MEGLGEDQTLPPACGRRQRRSGAGRHRRRDRGGGRRVASAPEPAAPASPSAAGPDAEFGPGDDDQHRAVDVHEHVHVDSGHHDHVDDLVLVVLLVGTGDRPAGAHRRLYSDHVAEFNVLCDVDHYAKTTHRLPGPAGRVPQALVLRQHVDGRVEHARQPVGAKPSSCGRGMGTSDLSAYWVPSLMKQNADGSTSVVKTDQTNVVYYRRAGGGTGPGVHPFPAGLRMIAGDAMARSDQSLSIVQWDCGGGGVESPHMYQCAGGSSAEIHASLIFPSCWDGVHLDSADHKSHMAYPASNGACPAGHPVSLPQVTFEVDFPGIAGVPPTPSPAVASTPSTATSSPTGTTRCRTRSSPRASTSRGSART